MLHPSRCNKFPEIKHSVPVLAAMDQVGTIPKGKPLFFLVPLALLALACTGGHRSGASGAQVVLQGVTLTPVAPQLFPGQTVQFVAPVPWCGMPGWSVAPPSAGTITAGGQFTASALPGTGTVFAVWSHGVGYTASTTFTILPAPAPDGTSPDYVQVSGAGQTSPDGAFSNGAVVGENVASTTSTSIQQGFTVRHGFLPPVPH